MKSQSFSQVEKIMATDRDHGDWFGGSVSIFGNYAVIGTWAESEDENGQNTLNGAGAAYIYRRVSGGNWNEIQKITASDRASGDGFGQSVAISGNYMVIGAGWETENVSGTNTLSYAGSAYVFELDLITGQWNEVQKIVASDRNTNNYFGEHVSISGNYILISSTGDDKDENGGNSIGGAGSAYIFERDFNGNWNEVQKIAASDRGADDRFSISVSISDDYLIIGADREDEDENGSNTMQASGSAYIFEKNSSGVWNEIQKLVASDRSRIDYFGSSVSISGDYAVIGAFNDSTDSFGLNPLVGAGSGYIFERNSLGVWSEISKITASDRAGHNNFGSSVAISGDYIVFGVERNSTDVNGNNPAYNSGSGYVFKKNSSGAWNELQKIVASDRDTSDNFGHDIAISGRFLIVGANKDDNLKGSNTIYGAGSAYIYDVVPLNVDALSSSTSKTHLLPNPTSSQLTINTELKISNIKITDISGKNIKTISTNLNVVNVEDLSDGIYFIKLITDDGTITKKFVKQ